MKILVRLPNWLGDMVMSVAFLYELAQQYPNAKISVVAKKGIHELLPFFPPLQHQFIFSRTEYKGSIGIIRFGRMIRNIEKFDLFFCMPDSFSSALMGFAIGAKKRIGYKKEFRGLLMTNTYSRPAGTHRVFEYTSLLELYTNKKASDPKVILNHSFERKNHVVVNINSEATSRRLTISKATEIIDALRKKIDLPIFLIGAPGEKAFVNEVFDCLSDKVGIDNLAGKTDLITVAEILASARLMLTTDSGPAHLANALGTHTVVLFGAGSENNTAPFNQNKTILRLNKLSCEPCVKNVCQQYAVPQCLQQLDTNHIVATVANQIHHNSNHG